MTTTIARAWFVWAALAGAIACGSSSGNESGSSASGGSGTGQSPMTGGAPAGSGAGPSTGAVSGTSGTTNAPPDGGPTLYPPNPRTDLGSPDGVTCDLQPGTFSSCGLGQECCRRFPFADNSCEQAGTSCDCSACSGDVLDVECDGPEDCPGGFCCGFEAGAGPGQEFARIACAPSCQRADQAVICKDARDCLSTAPQCAQSSISSIRECE